MTPCRGRYSGLAGWLALVALVVAEACSNEATPIPEPPSLDGDKIDLGPRIAMTDPIVWIVGEPGATEPRATIRLTNLDSTAEPVDVRADGSGGFELSLEIPEANEIRLQAIAADRRSDPVDLVYSDNVLVPAARHACFRVESGLSLGFGADSSGEILLQNECAADATVDAAGTRLALSDFALTSALPLVIAPGESAVVRVDHEAMSEDAREDVLFLNVGVDGDLRRYPVTLFAPAP